MENRAVIDIGSNSVRLLVVTEKGQRQWLETTRLGEGVDQRRLRPEPVRRTVEAIVRFCALARENGAQSICAFATSAVRDAVNPQELLEPVRRICGLDIDVLPGSVEAELAYLGAAQGARACVLDIGGASTEIVAGEGKVHRTVSLQVGAVRLRSRFEQDRAGATAFLDAAFAEQRAAFADFSDAPVWGIGGTVTTLAAMEQQMAVYDPARIQGYFVSRKSAANWVDRLWDLPAQQRICPGLQPARADIIAHGALILARFLTVFEREGVYASTGDNLMGYLTMRFGPQKQ